MIGASIETTLELWASSLREVKKRIRPLFAQERSFERGPVRGQAGDERRKTGWICSVPLAILGLRQQAVLGTRDRWDADTLRDFVRDYATEHLAVENAVLVIDETGFQARQGFVRGSAAIHWLAQGKITNCQIGVFAAYVSRYGHAFIDRALYLPKGWTDHSARLKRNRSPASAHFEEASA